MAGVTQQRRPPPARVPGNLWPRIEVPPLGGWSPERTVSVVVPYFERQHELDLTIAALGRQSYPNELVEVVVVDDGSARRPAIDPPPGLEVRVLVQENLGYGLTRARNLGAAEASSEILVFLDADMIPERRFLEAHARWHHAVCDAAAVGFRWHADFTQVTPGAVAAAVDTGTVRDLVAGRMIRRPEWIEGHLRRTENLTGPPGDYYRVMTGGNLSIRRDFYLAVGGNDELLDEYGGEDTEFGFRCLQAGAIVVPERAAVAWHQGEGHEQSREERRRAWIQRPLLDNLIADPEWREPQPGRSYTVPFAVVTVASNGSPPETTARTTESVLASRCSDLVVVVVVEGGDARVAEWLRRRFRSDGRVHVSSSRAVVDDRFRFSPLRVEVSSGVLLHPGTMDLVAAAIGPSGVGALSLSVPGLSGEGARVRAMTKRAESRGRRLAGSSDEFDSIVARLFGAREDDGGAFGVGSCDADGVVVEPELLTDEWTVEARLRRRLAEAERTITMLRRRRSLRLAESLGMLMRARSRARVREALRALGRTIRR